MEYQEWVKQVPEELRNDTLWKVAAYRLALFASDVGWEDVTGLMRDRRTVALSDQLYRALGSVSANVAEGYSRGTGKDRARFYEYALGSARESRDWYYKARHVLGEEISIHRMRLLTEAIKLILTMVPQQRGNATREPEVPYEADLGEGLSGEQLQALLQNVPVFSP